VVNRAAVAVALVLLALEVRVAMVYQTLSLVLP
jgi:hypothetical protein